MQRSARFVQLIREFARRVRELIARIADAVGEFARRVVEGRFAVGKLTLRSGSDATGLIVRGRQEICGVLFGALHRGRRARQYGVRLFGDAIGKRLIISHLGYYFSFLLCVRAGGPPD